MKLVKGKGSPSTGACWMSAISWYAGEKNWNDMPSCVCPTLRDLCVTLNDSLETDEDRERVIGPIMFSVVGTNDAADTLARRRALQDEVIQRALPTWNSSNPRTPDTHVLRVSFTQEECVAAVKGHKQAERDVQQAIHLHSTASIAIKIDATLTTEEYVELILRLAKLGKKEEVTQVRALADIS